MFGTDTDRRDSPRTAERYYGKYPGLRLENDSTEPEGASLRGEILVRVPGILEETPNGDGQRPFQAWAKPCFPAGFFVIPKVGDQLWVEFVAGDINSPIWSGSWYPNGAPPKTVDEQAPTESQKIIRTASGHLIQLDDTSGEEQVIVRHQSGANLTMDKHGSVVITNEQDKITLEMKDGKLTIKAGEMVNLECDAINLGGAAGQNILVAELFATFFNAHVHAHPMGPTLPPTVLLTPAALPNVTSTVVKIKS